MRSVGSLTRAGKSRCVRGDSSLSPSSSYGEEYPSFFSACDSLLAASRDLSLALSEDEGLPSTAVRSFLTASKMVLKGLKFRQERELKEALKSAREAVALAGYSRSGGGLSDRADLAFLEFSLEELEPLLSRFH